MPFRVGRKLRRTIYKVVDLDNPYDDYFCGIMETAEWADRVVAALNQMEEKRNAEIEGTA